MTRTPPSRKTSEEEPPRDDSIAEWLRKWQDEGDHEALDQLLQVEVKSLKRRIQQKGRSMLTQSFSASDVANDAIVKLLRRGDAAHFDDAAQLRVYLWKAAWRLLIDRVRRPKLPRPRLDADSANRISDLAERAGSRSVEKREARNAVTFALQLLPQADRSILELSYLKGLVIADLAERLGISREAVAMRLVRARRKLSSKLRAWQDLIG